MIGSWFRLWFLGAIRYCEFSTGPFIEPITRWEPGRVLAFDVTAQPHSMHELSLYDVVHAPHLGGTFQTRRGAFVLEPTEQGGTLLRGTTWYVLDMAPAFYWSTLTDSIIAVIHQRVLRHVKWLSEATG